jgi:hypothetical protein
LGIAVLCFTVRVAEPERGADQAVAHRLVGRRLAIERTCFCAHCFGDDGIVDSVRLSDRHFLGHLSLRSGRHEKAQGEGREAYRDDQQQSRCETRDQKMCRHCVILHRQRMDCSALGSGRASIRHLLYYRFQELSGRVVGFLVISPE